MRYLMSPYDHALETILKNGVFKSDRTGTGCFSVAGLQCRYRLDLDNYFPLVTRRKLFPKAIFAELLWFLSGSSNTLDLNALGATFWDKWRDPEFEAKHDYNPGDLGPVYGFQLRHFGADYKTKTGGFDQLAYMVNELKTNKHSRRILFNLWNPVDLDKMRLPPCHFTYQVITVGEDELTGILTQRSADFPIGVPANIQFYSALTIMLAQVAGLQPYEFVHNTNDSHIYADQIAGVEEYLASPVLDSPRLIIKPKENILDYGMDDFELLDFNPGKKINIPVAV